MDRLQAMQVFTRVVEASSFTKAADNLQLPRATVTNLVQSLEAHLGVRLLHRTTRRVNVTADGAAYYERCVRILGDLEETEAAFSQSASGARGTLRIDVPGSIGKRLLVPRIRDFHDAYPGLQLEIGMSDRTVDLPRKAWTAPCASASCRTPPWSRAASASCRWSTAPRRTTSSDTARPVRWRICRTTSR